ncbi:hypothetical protein MAR_034465 [Mya arenaria]|uniref:Uncharacterized protein n=1 Tax=Mya arenaria TaxID=6604 RepID=A0ABY7GC00_MYAAR|nr:hypothetical protein MAR_034465 [Mya arenaria]
MINKRHKSGDAMPSEIYGKLGCKYVRERLKDISSEIEQHKERINFHIDMCVFQAKSGFSRIVWPK